MTIVAILTVRRAALAAFIRFEHAAGAIMPRHGGARERSIRVDDGAGDTLREVHIVTFASAAGWDAYRADPELVALAALRAEAITATELLIGEDVPT